MQTRYTLRTDDPPDPVIPCRFIARVTVMLPAMLLAILRPRHPHLWVGTLSTPQNDAAVRAIFEPVGP